MTVYTALFTRLFAVFCYENNMNSKPHFFPNRLMCNYFFPPLPRSSSPSTHAQLLRNWLRFSYHLRACFISFGYFVYSLLYYRGRSINRFDKLQAFFFRMRFVDKLPSLESIDIWKEE